MNAGTFEFAGLAGSILLALSVGWIAAVVLNILMTPRAMAGTYTENRRAEQLRQRSPVFRWLEPLIQDLARINSALSATDVNELQQELELLPDMPPWKATEWIAAKQVEAFLLAIPIASVLYAMGGMLLTGIGFVAVLFGYQKLVRKALKDDSQARLNLIRQRLPYAVDLMALTMEAGATFPESLTTVVRENRDHPLGEEFAHVLRAIEFGRTRREALDSLRNRVREEAIEDLVFAVIKGEDLGTPLKDIFLNQADQLRQKRSYWIEKAIGKAQVDISAPGLFIAGGCVIIILTPFILRALNTGSF